MNHDTPVKVVAGSQARLAFRFTRATIRLHIPGNVVGSYLLLDCGHPVYIGRSDTCLRRRLEAHPLRGAATHVAWEPAVSPDRAFLSEAFWFHELHSDARVLNLAHPARPAGSAQSCAYCSGVEAERKALLRALRAGATARAAHSGAAQLVTDISAPEPKPAGAGGSGKKEGHCNG